MEGGAEWRHVGAPPGPGERTHLVLVLLVQRLDDRFLELACRAIKRTQPEVRRNPWALIGLSSGR